jgi:hypothetical protein
MKKLDVTAFVLIVIMLLSVTYSLVMADTSNSYLPIKVGAFYYVWYDGELHANTVDTPVLATNGTNYCSNSSSVIRQHLFWFN